MTVISHSSTWEIKVALSVKKIEIFLIDRLGNPLILSLEPKQALAIAGELTKAAKVLGETP